ncbi:uncharacterized protein [Asterias amurensis]|uniref:uncharacterized protein isoform X2 n=1 Tax=Asterias amurensis TaxID=7602 RepID=UPI003AB55CFA
MVLAPQVVEDSCAVSIGRYSYINLGDFSSTCVADFSFCVSAGFTWAVWLKMDYSKFNGYRLNPIVGPGEDDGKRSNFNLWITHDYKYLFCSALINDITVVRGIKVGEVNVTNSWFHVSCVFNSTSTVDTAVARIYINAIENDGWYIDHFDFRAQLNSLGQNLSLGHSIGTLPLDSKVALSNLVVTDGPLENQAIQGLYACGSLDWDLKLRSLVWASKEVDPATLQLVCTASALTGPSITWSIYKSKLGVLDDVTGDAENGVLIKNDHASSCVLTSTLTVENYRKLGYTGSVFVCSTSTPSSVSRLTVNITIPDQPELYEWSLGDHGTVDLMNGDSCNKAVFTDGTIYDGFTTMTPAPQVVEDSCAVLMPEYSSTIILGNYKDSCVSDYRICKSTGYTWAVWLKVGNNYPLYEFPYNILSTRVAYENRKFTFRLWITRDLKFLVCEVNTETHIDKSPYRISKGVIVTSFVQQGSFADCPWFHVACSVNLTHTEDFGRIEMYINGDWTSGSTDNFVNDLDFNDPEKHFQIGDLILGGMYYYPRFVESVIAFSTLVLTDGLMSDEDIGHLYSCGSTEWDLKLRSLMRVMEDVSQFDLQFVCTASDSTGPSIAWRVYKPKHQVFDDVTDDEDKGVQIENNNMSSCVLTSTLTITNYRKLGFSGSVFTCLAYCSSNKTFESANWTVEDQPKLYKWSLGGNDTVYPTGSCNEAGFADNVMFVSAVGLNASLVPAPLVVEESCSVLKPEHSYFDLGSFKDTCVSDYRFCMSTGYTWSLWLKIESYTQKKFPYSVVSTEYDNNRQSNFRLWITQDSKFMVCSATKNNGNTSIVTKYSISKGFNISGVVSGEICSDCPWFHVACVVDIENDVIDTYVNGVLIDNGFHGDYDSEQFYTSTPNLHLGDELGEFVIVGETKIAFSNLLLMDGNIGDEDVRKLFTCGSLDWSPKVRSLNEVTKGVDQSHLRFVCTASASSGLDIAWRIYHSQCDVWKTLQNGTDDIIVIEQSNVSSCVRTSTLTILNYLERLISGSVVMCVASNQDASHNKTASFLTSQTLTLAGMSTSQSTTYGNLFAPQKAIDGSQASFSHTGLQDPHPWWKLDLGGEHWLGQITVQLRTQCCGPRFIGATVRAGLSSNYFNNQQCGKPATSAQSYPGAINVFLCDPPVMARWVSIDIDPSYPGSAEAILQLAEVSLVEYTWERYPKTTTGTFKLFSADDSRVLLQESRLKVQQLESLSPFDQSDVKIQCKVSAVVASFITWQVYRPRCKAWENLSNHTDAGTRIEEEEKPFCDKMSTLTIFNFRERGYGGSAIFCSTKTPYDAASDSAHLMIPDNFGIGTEDWTLNVDLTHVPTATNSSDIQLRCTANAVSGPTIAWRVYHSKCGIWERLLRSEMKDGVSIEQRSLSHCVEVSVLTITNYRERGYSGSEVECSASTPGNDHVEVNFSTPEINSDEQIEDWTLKLHSLERLTGNISQFDLQLSCTASASSGPSIAWNVFFPVCSVWSTPYREKELGVLVEERATSPCLKTSTLTISDYAERGYHGAVIKCRASATRISKSSYTKITIQDYHSTADPLSNTHIDIHRLAQLPVGVNGSNLHLQCTSSITRNPIILWRVYQSRCGIWENFRINRNEGVTIENKELSSCLQTSTLTIFSYLQEGYNGAIIECSMFNTRQSANYSANFTISENETNGDIAIQQVKIDSLVEVNQGVNRSNKQLLCTAIGSSIEWRVCTSNLTSLVINDTYSDVIIERNRVSSCVFSSTLTILNHLEHRYAGSVVMCTTSIPANTANHSANFTLPSVEEVEVQNIEEMNCTSLELVQLDASANSSDGQFVCTVQGNANISHSWHVTRSKCGHLDVVDLEASIRINAQKRRLSEYMQNSTMTMTNYSNEGFDWSVITCSTFDPWTGTNCSINLTITGAVDASLKSTSEGLSLTEVIKGFDQSYLRLACNASTDSNVLGFRWEVYQPACRLQTALLSLPDTGVHIQEAQVSPCVRSSMLDISDYRERGYGGSTIVCRSTSADNSSIGYSANFTVQDFSNGGVFHSSDNITDSNDLHVFNNLETTDRDRDICGASRTYDDEERVKTVFVMNADAGEYANIDTELDNQVYSVKIPSIESSDGNLIAVISVYKSSSNFSGSNGAEKPLTFGSRIIEVTVFNEQGSKITNFSNAHVSLTFPVLGMPGYEPVCSFSSGMDNDWATDGCVISNFNGYDNSYWSKGNGSVNITCSCDHLTHFAVLLRLGEVEETFDTYVLDVLTKIGLALSIVCLAVTLMAYTLLRLTSIRIVTHANLAFALMVSDVIFFFIDTQNVVGCTLVAILLHFFLLAAFTWMALEGAFLYIKVNPTFPWRIRLPIWLLIGWGFPLGVVVISAAVNFGGYAGNDRLVSIFFSLKANKKKSDAKKLKSGLRLAIVLEPLLGLPWVLGLFYTGKETVVFAYAFVLFNSFQGVFVFLGQCVFDQEVMNSFKSRSSKVETVSIPQDSTSFTLTSKQTTMEPTSTWTKESGHKSL